MERRREQRPAVSERANAADAAAEGHILDDEGGAVNLIPCMCESIISGNDVCWRASGGWMRRRSAAAAVMMLDEEQPERSGLKGR